MRIFDVFIKDGAVKMVRICADNQAIAQQYVVAIMGLEIDYVIPVG